MQPTAAAIVPVAIVLAAVLGPAVAADGTSAGPAAPAAGTSPPAAPAQPAAPAVPPKAGDAGSPGPRQRPFAARGAFAAERKELEFWRQALEETATELSPEVLEKARSLRTDFEARVQSWRQENAERLRALEAAMRGERDPESMRELKEALDSAPRVQELKDAFLALLTPEEQQRFKARVAEIRKGAEKMGAGTGKPAAGQAAPRASKPREKGGDGRTATPEDAPDVPNRKGDGKPSGR